MHILAVQYLESNPDSFREIQETVRSKLRTTLDILPREWLELVALELEKIE